MRASSNLLQLDAPPLSRLTLREGEIALLVRHGFSNEEAAQRPGKSVLMVKKQLHWIYPKLAVANRGRVMMLIC